MNLLELEPRINFIKKHISAFLSLAIVIIIILICIIGLILVWYLPIANDIKSISNHLTGEETKKIQRESNIPPQEVVKTVVHDDVAKSLEHVGDEIKEIRQSLSVIDSEDKKISGGINNTLGKWQISVYEGNKYKLKNGDAVVITNKTYGKHRPSAIFEVVSVVKKESSDGDSDRADIFMNLASAESLDIPVNLGIFDINFRVLPQSVK